MGLARPRRGEPRGQDMIGGVPVRSVSVVALLALLSCGCSGNRTSRAERLVESISIEKGSDIGQVRKLAEKGVAYLRPLLKSEKQIVRVTVIEALGCIKDDKEATQLLLDTIKGEDANDAAFALASLARQGAPEAKEIILHQYQSPDPFTRSCAVRAIYEYGDKELYPLIDRAMSDDDPDVRRTAKMTRQVMKSLSNAPKR